MTDQSLILTEQWKAANNSRCLLRRPMRLSMEDSGVPLLDRLHCWDFCYEDNSILLIYDDLANPSQIRFHQLPLVYDRTDEMKRFPFPRFGKDIVCVAIEAQSFRQDVVWAAHLVVKHFFFFIVMEKLPLSIFMRPQLYVYDMKKRDLNCHNTNRDCHLPSAPLCLVSVDENRLNLIHPNGIITIGLDNNGAPVLWTFGSMQYSPASRELSMLSQPALSIARGRECVFVLNVRNHHLFMIQLAQASVKEVPLSFDGYTGSPYEITMNLVSWSEGQSYLYFSLNDRSWTLHQPPALEGCHTLGPLPTAGFLSGGAYWRDRGLLLQMGITHNSQQKSCLTLVATAMGNPSFMYSLPGFRHQQQPELSPNSMLPPLPAPSPSSAIKSLEPTPSPMKFFQSAFKVKNYVPDEQQPSPPKKPKTATVPDASQVFRHLAMAAAPVKQQPPSPPSPFKDTNFVSYSLSHTARPPVYMRVLRPVDDEYDQLESFLRENTEWYASLQLFTRFVPSGGDSSYVYLGISHLLLKNVDCMEVFTSGGLIEADEWRKLEGDMEAPLSDKPLKDGQDPLVPAAYEKALTVTGLSVLELVTLLTMFHYIRPLRKNTMTFLLAMITRLNNKRLASHVIKFCKIYEDWCRETEFSELLNCVYHPKAAELGLDALRPLVCLVYRDLLSRSQSDSTAKHTLERVIETSSNLFLNFLRDLDSSDAKTPLTAAESATSLKRTATQLY